MPWFIYLLFIHFIFIFYFYPNFFKNILPFLAVLQRSASKLTALTITGTILSYTFLAPRKNLEKFCWNESKMSSAINGSLTGNRLGGRQIRRRIVWHFSLFSKKFSSREFSSLFKEPEYKVVYQSQLPFYAQKDRRKLHIFLVMPSPSLIPSSGKVLDPVPFRPVLFFLWIFFLLVLRALVDHRRRQWKKSCFGVICSGINISDAEFVVGMRPVFSACSWMPHGKHPKYLAFAVKYGFSERATALTNSYFHGNFMLNFIYRPKCRSANRNKYHLTFPR